MVDREVFLVDGKQFWENDALMLKACLKNRFDAEKT